MLLTSERHASLIGSLGTVTLTIVVSLWAHRTQRKKLQAARQQIAEQAVTLEAYKTRWESTERVYNQAIADNFQGMLDGINSGSGKEASVALWKAHRVVIARKRRIIQQRFNLARDAKVEVVDALNAENVPSEETLALQNDKIELEQRLSDLVRELNNLDEKAEHLLELPY